MERELRHILRDHSDHACIVRTGRHLTEDHLVALDEELHAEYAVASERVSDLLSYLAGRLDGLRRHGLRLPGIAVVAVDLDVAYRFAERRSGYVAHCKERDLIVEIHETLHDYASGAGSPPFLSLFPGVVDLVGVLYYALAMARRAHDGLHHAGDAYLLHGLVEFLACGGESIGRGLDAEFLMGEAADSFTVHRKPRGASRGGHVVALFLEFHKGGCGDSLDLGDDMVGLLKLHDAAELIAVEHVEDVAAVGHLHRGSTRILVAGHYLHAEALELESHFLAEFSATEEHRLAPLRSLNTSNLCHFYFLLIT